MARIFTFGEALVDITFRDDRPVSAWPGGAMLNTSVSLGRLGMPVSLITEYGRDRVGTLIDTFLRENGVDTSHAARFSGHRTSLALAFLDRDHNASYVFYKDPPRERLATEMPALTGEDMLLFGSFFALDKGVRPVLNDLLEKARRAGTFILYDPNFRKAHLDELSDLKASILDNLSAATLVRGSDEDFLNIFGTPDADTTYEEIRERVPWLVHTSSSRVVSLRTPRLSLDVEVPSVKVVSTVGAGDTFNAGLAYELFRRRITPAKLEKVSREAWLEILRTAIRLAGRVCGTYENYIPEHSADEVRS